MRAGPQSLSRQTADWPSAPRRRPPPARLQARYVLTPKSVEVVMAKSEQCQWAGLRFLYLAITGVVWIFGGELAFLGGTLLMRHFLASVDSPPALAEITDAVDDSNAGYAI